MIETVLKFISNFKDAKEMFSNGCCYWFAQILAKRFNGIIMYNVKENHFACAIQYYDAFSSINDWYLFDINGLLVQTEYIVFEDYKKIDSAHYNRIVRDCINMTAEECEDEY